MNHRHVILLGCLTLLLFSPFSSAHATGVQMLPPVQSSDKQVPCTDAQGNKVLSWDGSSAITCNESVRVENSGILTAEKGIKLGDEQQCDEENTGTLIYLDNKNLAVCDGTNWKKVTNQLEGCHVVSGTAMQDPSIAKCSPGEIAVSGGGICESPRSICQSSSPRNPGGYPCFSAHIAGTSPITSFFVLNMPLTSTFGEPLGWTTDCDAPSTTQGYHKPASLAYAVCCKATTSKAGIQ